MRAIVAKRADTGEPDTTEIVELATAAGYEVADVVAQTRAEDSAYQLGEGKARELADRTEESGAETVIVDNRLGPYQRYNLGQLVPAGVEVLDRFTLILEIFAQRASTRTAQLQVELAELRYELPRVEAKASLAQRDEHPGFMGLGEYDESRKEDIADQISRITDELEGIQETEAQRRQRRRQSGFDLVALAGYTNAGKSTLLRRLADELAVDENEDIHPDLDPTAASEDQLFTTLGTTTRSATLEDRSVLVTDTVGFITDLPHWLVESFQSTLDSVYRADLVLLVVDASESVEEIHTKLATCHDTLYARNEAPIVTVLNKVDRVDAAELAEKREALSSLAPDPVAVSAREGTGMAALRARIQRELPEWQTERLVLPQTDESMGLVSWIHDNANVEDVTYGATEVQVTFAARPAIVGKARSRAGELEVPPA